jgi:DNA primase catalytic core
LHEIAEREEAEMMEIDGDALAAMKRLHLPTIMEEYGIQLKRTGRDTMMGRCPFHEDTTPSLSVSLKGELWLWNCFGCHAGGNVVDFKMKKDRSTFRDTYRGLLPKINGNGHIETIPPPATTNPVKSPAASSIPPSELMARVVEIYHGSFCESRPAQDYLAGRGIKDGELFRHFKVGFADGRLRRMLPEDPAHEFTAGLTAVGVLNEKGGEFFHGCVTFPILDENGAVVGMYGRRAVGSGPAHLYLPGPHRGVWNAAAVKAHPDLVLTESIIDALSLLSVGVTNAVPLYGVNGLTEDHVRLMKERRTRRIYLCLDNDEAGDRAREPLMEKLSALGVEVLSYGLPRKFKDPNEALTKGFPREEFLVLTRINSILANARKIAALGETPPPMDGAGPSSAPLPSPRHSPTAEPPAPAVPAPVLPSTRQGYPTVEQTEEGIIFNFGARKYRVKGLSAKNRDALRVNIKVEASGGCHMDTFDLCSAKLRAAFVGCCRKIIEAAEGDLNRELNRIIEELERIQAGMADGKEGGEKRDEGPPAMTPEQEAAAMKALKDPALLPTVIRDMGMIYVGEDHNKAVGYLVGTSRKMDDPLSCVTISQSGAGKSVLVETVERMTPPEDVRMYSRMTQFSLYYEEREGFKHKLLISEERAGAEEADYSIRTLLSKKRLTLAVPVKDPATNQIRTETKTVEGPVAYMETTTKPRINDENATRSFLLFLDESEEQTRRIHERQRQSKTLGGLRGKSSEEAMIRRHHDMQRLLRTIAVVIPFADALTFPSTWLRTRRDNMRFLNLIQVITFLHQYQRPTRTTEEGVDYIESTPGDYRAAYELARQVLGESFQDLKKPQRELLKAIEELRPIATTSTDGPGVSRRQIREATGLADTRLRELLADLVSLEYVREVSGGGQGRLCRYAVTDRMEATEKQLVGLTTPEELEKRLLVLRFEGRRPPTEPVTGR